MILQDGKTVRTGNGILIWDGLRNPNHRDSGSVDYNVVVAFPNGDPTLKELEQIAEQELATGALRGQRPVGDDWPLGKMVDQTKIPELPGYTRIKFGTGQGVPPLFNSDAQQVDIMQAGQWLYPGCMVQVLVPGCYTYTNKRRGIAFNLGSLMFVDPSAPQLSVGTGLSPADAAAAWATPATTASPAPGTVNAPTPVVPAPAGAPRAPAPGFVDGPPAPAAPAGPQMTAKAEYTYDQYIAVGWNDAQLRAAGLMV